MTPLQHRPQARQIASGAELFETSEDLRQEAFKQNQSRGKTLETQFGIASSKALGLGSVVT